jgi:hypothetical protein
MMWGVCGGWGGGGVGWGVVKLYESFGFKETFPFYTFSFF